MKPTVLSDFLALRLNLESSEPTYRQLYRVLQQAILSGQLPIGTQLPPSRTLAKELGVARNTVTHVYSQLAVEGYVTSTIGSGTYVADTAPEKNIGATRRKLGTETPTPSSPRKLSKRGERLVEMAGASKRQWEAFVPGVPDVTQFPAKIWNRLLSKHWRRPKPELLTYAHGGGHMPLRRTLADYLGTARSVRCRPEQIIITTGIHQSLHLIAQLLSDAGDTAWVEDPCYWGARNVLIACGLQTVPVEIDNEGMNPSAEQLKTPPRFMFLSPSHQYPLGNVMSLARRRLLLEYAKHGGSWIIEDDYDSEFRYGSRPLASLQGLDNEGQVLYVGTFSKILFPGLRLGYLVVPEALVDHFATGLSELYREGQLMLQAVLTDFIAEGYFTSHIRRMRLLYGERRTLLIDAIRKNFGDKLSVSGSDAGLHLILRLPDSVDDQALSESALSWGIVARPLSRYYSSAQNAQRGLLLGYACVPNDTIAPAFDKLATLITERLP
ncbi:MAG: PLP-dependent aminotransferase family protein [Gammaproteobacteria bacterium]|nr:PLP-dependent aminotransferase family protein [Gammaproteobacteria bacterium]